MKKYKILVLIGILLSAGVSSLVFVNVVYLQVQQKQNDEQSKELCKFITDGLKFCTDREKIVINPNDSVTLNFSFTNTSLREMDLSRYDGGNYTFKVIGEKGDTKLTKFERKMKERTMSDDDYRNFIRSFTRNHRFVLMQPNQIYNEKIELSRDYDFTSAGKYRVEITRRTINPKNEEEANVIETALGKIEIVVEDETNPK